MMTKCTTNNVVLYIGKLSLEEREAPSKRLCYAGWGMMMKKQK